MTPDQKAQAARAGPPGALARPDWRAGGEFTASDLRLEQRYRRQRLRRHLRLVHGWGVVCGLTVVSGGDGWCLFVCPGYGISPCGDEIEVFTRYPFNLCDYLWTRPLDANAGNQAWIAIEAVDYGENLEGEPHCGCGCGCGCHETHPKSARVGDGFRVVVSWTPPTPVRTTFNVCSGATPPCPACPETCGLTLARVTLPASTLEPVLSSAIDHTVFRGQ